MKDYLKILKVEYISNNWSDHPKMLTLSLYDHKTKKYFNWRRPPMEDDLKYKKWNISATTFKVKIRWAKQIYKCSYGKNLKHLKCNISAITMTHTSYGKIHR
jgi:hypothetical protein